MKKLSVVVILNKTWLGDFGFIRILERSVPYQFTQDNRGHRIPACILF